MKITLIVNGKPADVQVDDPDMPLLYAVCDAVGVRLRSVPFLLAKVLASLRGASARMD
jgi:hypothetical protein